jgi:dynein heavy chain
VLLDSFALGAPSPREGAKSRSLPDLQAAAAALREQQALLGVPAADPGAALARCQEELALLRTLWDAAASVLATFSRWGATPWSGIDADSLLEETKKLGKEVRSLPRAVREYEAWRGLEERVKGMATALPLVGELAHPAMRARHWAALAAVSTGARSWLGRGCALSFSGPASLAASQPHCSAPRVAPNACSRARLQATGASLPADPASSLTLEGLLALDLHCHGDVCAEIVDTAKKELVIEKALAKMDAAWGGLRLGFAPLPGRADGLNTLVVDEAVTEALEGDCVALQNMAAGKAVAGSAALRSAVATWQRRLGGVEAVLGVWGDAQRKWGALESIFCGSADIRAQLPQDSARFDAINADYKVAIFFVLVFLLLGRFLLLCCGYRAQGGAAAK